MEEMRLQKEANKMVEKLNSLKQLEEAKHRIEVATQELEKVKGEMKDYRKNQKWSQSLQDECA